MSDHIQLDKRSLVLHQKIASKLLQRPDLIERARSNLIRWRQQSGEEAWMTEWIRILDLPLDDIVKFLCEEGEHATRLRQSSPFTGVLTNTERSAIFQEFAEMRDHISSIPKP